MLQQASQQLPDCAISPTGNVAINWGTVEQLVHQITVHLTIVSLRLETLQWSHTADSEIVNQMRARLPTSLLTILP